VDLQAYKEHGSLAPLQILDSGASDVRTDVGVKLSYAAQYRGALIRPYLHAAWEHAYSSSQDTVCAKLPGGSRSIASESPYLGADGAVIGGGVTVDFRSFTFFLSDEYRTGRAGYSSNIINGGMRTGF
jgi:outer membrane autotransporter protein